MANNKIRLSVPFSPQIYERIQVEAEKRGVSMSTYVAFIVGDYIARIDSSNQEISNKVSNVLNQSLERQNDMIENMPNDKLIEIMKSMAPLFKPPK